MDRIQQTGKHNERMKRFCQAGLYLVSSESLSCGRKTVDIVRAALAAGVRLIQLREKGMTTSKLFSLAKQVRQMTEEANALLIINDRVDVALAAGADGVHLGQDDFPVSVARSLAPELIIGVSIHSVLEAHAAESAGASYVNIGPIFPTHSKEWPGKFLGIEGVKAISQAVSIPFTVMGGIKKKHIPALLKAGARIIAVITAITAANEPERESKELLSLIKNPYHLSLDK